MAPSHHFLLVILSCLACIHLATQDDPCVPGPVINLTLNGNNTLSWETSPDEECSISQYLVQIATTNGTIHYSYTVLNPTTYIDHLERCTSYTFRVYQVSSDDVTGPAWAIYTVTPPGEDANLALDYIRVTQTGRDIRVQWSLEDEYIRCARHYRVVAHNQDTDVVEDIYTTLTNAVINDVIPCAFYHITVRALFTLEEEGPATMVRHTANPIATSAPDLVRLTLEDTAVSFAWSLEEYSHNRCPISSLIIDGSPYFNVTYTIRDQENRSPIPLRLTGLLPDTLYYLKVTANNTAGPSEPFQLGIQTLASD